MAKDQKEQGSFTALWMVLALLVAIGTWMFITPEHLLNSLAGERAFVTKLSGQQADQWIEQHRKNGDCKQRATIPQLIAHLAVIDELYVAPVHFRCHSQLMKLPCKRHPIAPDQTLGAI